MKNIKYVGFVVVLMGVLFMFDSLVLATGEEDIERPLMIEVNV